MDGFLRTGIPFARGMSAAYALAAIAVLTVAAVAYWYRKSVKLSISDLVITPGGGLLVSVPVTTFSDNVYGRKLVVNTKSLGRIVTSLCSYTVLPGGQNTIIATSDNAYRGNGIYQADASDHLLISSM